MLDSPRVDLSPDHAVADSRAAVQVGLYASAIRCLLTYVVAPALGALGVVLGPIGLLLQVLGTITSVNGAQRLWRLGHRARHAYALVAATLVALTLVSLIGALG